MRHFCAMNHEPSSTYQAKLKELEQRLSQLKRQQQNWSWFRLFTILAFGFSGYQYLATNQMLFQVLSILAFALFVWAVRKHWSAKSLHQHTQAEQQEYQQEMDYLGAKWERLEKARWDVDSAHPFAADLNLKGNQSLWQALNRCFSPQGSTLLREELLDPPHAESEIRAAHFAELNENHPRQIRFRALGRRADFSPNTHELLELWLKEPQRKLPWWLVVMMVLGLLAISASLYLVVADFSPLHFKFLTYSLGFNLLLSFSQWRDLKRQSQGLAQVHPAMKAYAALMRALEEWPLKNQYGAQIRREHGFEENPSQALKRLGRILSAFDQMSNPVVLVFANGLFHYHLHQLRYLARWQENHGKDLELWLRGIHRMEADMAYAQFAYNHPNYTQAIKVNEPLIVAQKLGHPLISGQERVPNDFSLNDYQYLILTGSNMSGKSTFLRTIGLNLLLAELGLPVCADRFEYYPFQLLSSMSPTDDLSANTSYFQAEILRLRSLVDWAEREERWSFLILDEILRGTNSKDKQEGTFGFMRRIKSLRAKGILATHDIALGDLAQSEPVLYRAAYFESKMQGEELYFDYKLRSGVCTSPNASLLLKQNGLID